MSVCKIERKRKKERERGWKREKIFFRIERTCSCVINVIFSISKTKCYQHFHIFGLIKQRKEEEEESYWIAC